MTAAIFSKTDCTTTIWWLGRARHTHRETSPTGIITTVMPREVCGALLTGYLFQQLKEGWERFTVRKTRGLRASHLELVPQYSSNDLRKLRGSKTSRFASKYSWKLAIVSNVRLPCTLDLEPPPPPPAPSPWLLRAKKSPGWILGFKKKKNYCFYFICSLQLTNIFSRDPKIVTLINVTNFNFRYVV